MRYINAFIILTIVGVVFHSWFNPFANLSSGDWPYLFTENIKEFSFIPNPQSLWLGAYYQIPAKILVEYLHISWDMTEKLLWFWPFVIISVASSYYLTRSWIGVILFTTNTYILMVVGGGQMGVGMAYAIAPFVLARFIKIIQNSEFRILNSLSTGLVLAIQTMFDPRITYITMIAVVFYAIFHSRSWRNFFPVFIIPIGVAMIINIYWIIPLMQKGATLKTNGIFSLAGFQFLSFADFSHAISLLHPNWPENIFGKVYFLQPEFLILPIIAFSSLLFVNSKFNHFNNKTIFFFAFLGLLGAFLAKGVNPPFGQINEWLFSHFPGMSMFRDATKFYLLIILSYSVLIPFSLKETEERMLSIKHVKALGILFLLFWVFTISPAVRGQLGGTFKPHIVPKDYLQLKDFLTGKPEFFKTLWIPQVQRFGFYSNNHPAVSAQDYFTISDSISLAQAVLDEKNQIRLKQARIKYIIVPYDSEEELFIKDRKYSGFLRQSVEGKLKRGQKLRKLPSIGRISIYEFQ